MAFMDIKVNAVVLDSKFLVKQIKKSVTEQVNSMVKGHIEVEVTELPYKLIEIPKDADASKPFQFCLQSM